MSQSRQVKKRRAPNKSVGRMTEAGKKLYLENVANTGVIRKSAEGCGASYQQFAALRQKDPEFRAAFEHAMAMYQEKIEEEIARRAIDGYDEPVFYQGNVVGVVRRYSDQLLLAHAKRHIPEYGDKLRVDATVRAGVLVVNGGDINKDAWTEKYKDAEVIDDASEG